MVEPQRKKLLSTSKPPTLKDIEGIRYETVQTSSTLPIRDDRQLVFHVPAQKGFYIDMSQIKMHTFYRITRKNGSQTAGSDNVLTQSATLYTMFKDLQLNLNNRTVHWGRFLYPFYCNLLLLFKIPANERKLLYSSSRFYDDSADLVPVRTSQEVTEDGKQVTKHTLTGYTGADLVADWDNRVRETQRSNQLEVMGSVLFDMAFQPLLLRDDMNMDFIFTPHNSEFCLMSGKLQPAFTLEIVKSYIQVPRISVRPSAALPAGDLTYYYVEHRMQSIPVAESTQNFNRSIITGPIPRRIILTQMAESAFDGDYTQSCFSFPHYNMDSIQILAGSTRIPIDPLTTDWAKEDILAAYTSFFVNMRSSLGFAGMPFDKTEFSANRVWHAFDLTRDMMAGAQHWTPSGSGNLSLNIHWKNPLPHNIVLCLCLEYEMTCHLDKYGQASVNYAPLYN